jgi:uncharacterized protein (TIGR02231 family)
MKKSILALTAIACISSLYAENRVPSLIKEATIYRSGAKLHNVADVRLIAGENTIVFEKLSLGCNPQSIQVRIKGNAKLMSAAFRTNTIETIKPDFTKGQKIQDSIEVLSESLARLSSETTILKQEEHIIEQNQSRVGSGQGTVSNPISINELKELVNYYRTRVTEIKSRLLDIAKQERKLQKQQGEMQERYNKALQNESETAGEIVMQITSAMAQSVEITCIYLVNSASWKPLYDLRAESVDKPLNLIYKASVYQSSGVDWKNVKLHLSSAMPLVDNSRPILSPKYIDYQVIQYNAYGKNKAMPAKENYNFYQLQNSAQAPMMNDAKVYPVPAAEEIRPELIGFQEDNTQSFNEVFDIEALHTIVNNATDEQIIEYNAQEIPAIYEYHAVPKVEPAVFLLAKIIDYGKYNLLSGNANIFYKDTYIGQSYIDTKTTLDTLLLSLGRDEEIVIKRVKPTDVTTAPRLFNNHKKETIAYDIIIKNNKSVPISIEVLDQIPISKNSEIEVELDEKNGAEYNKDYGKLLWRIKVPERKNKTIRFSYTVKYPKDKVVNCH